MTTEPMYVAVTEPMLAATGCDNDHLAGFAAIECLDSRVQPVEGATPVQRCDGCFNLGADWLDEEAAEAVAGASGGRVLLDPSMLQPFVIPAFERPYCCCGEPGHRGHSPEDLRGSPQQTAARAVA